MYILGRVGWFINRSSEGGKVVVGDVESLVCVAFGVGF
jgi:hypothetical protein